MTFIRLRIRRLNKTETIKVSQIKMLKFYVGMIMDTYNCVKFLNKLPLGVLEESLSIFRNNIFNMSDRKMIPVKIYETLMREY